MTTPDSSFLAEVEEFLSSCEIPTFAVIDALSHGDHDNGETASTTVVDTKPHNQQVVVTRRERERAMDRKRRSTYRECRRVERESLKQQVAELSAEVEELKQPRPVDLQLTSSMWKLIAQKQLQARLNSEAEQYRLVVAIDARAKLIQEFKAFVHSRLAVEGTFSGQAMEPSYHYKKMRVEPIDAEMMSEFVQELDKMFVRTDSILQEMFKDDKQVGHDWRVDKSTGAFTFVDTRVLPFTFQKTSQFMWSVAHLVHRQIDRQVIDVQDPENTMALRFRISAQLQSARMVSVLQRVVSRRYQEENRHVVVWKSFTEGEGMFTGMLAREEGFCVTTPLGDGSTLVRTYLHNVPMHFVSPADEQSSAVQQFTGVMLNRGNEDSTEIGNRLEKLLLTDGQA